MAEITGLPALSGQLADAVERASASVVAVDARRHVPTSGIQWAEGVVVTADHGLRREEDIGVTLPGGRAVPATLAGRDAATDLAVLKVAGIALPAPDLADAATLRIGHMALAVARTGDGGPAASLGVISALGGPWRTWRGGQLERYIRLDLEMYPGFSGGPLVDVHGRVIGMNTSGLTRHAGVAVPAATVARVVEELLHRGHVARGYVGLGLQPVRLPESLRTALKLEGDTGLIVLTVQPSGPADRAGLLIGDVLVALDGARVADTDDVQAAVGGDHVGRAVRATILRAGALLELAVTVGERPGPAQ